MCDPMSRLRSYFLFLLLISVVMVWAQSPVGQAPDQANWPQKVTVTVGDIRIRIDGPKMWTLSGMDWRNTTMATEDSAYGTVFTIRDVGHLGTAHFLDVPGKPGEIEKEIVTSLRLLIDDKPVTEFTPTMELSGTSFRLERRSKIRGIALESSVSIRDDVLIETVHLHARQPLDSVKAHPLMYAWTPTATVGMFGDENGILKRSVFLKEGKGAAEVLRNARWVAVFDPVSGKGSVCYFRKQPADDPEALLLVDEPGVYRKVALYSLEDKIVPVGWDGTFQSLTGFFSATEADWEKKALLRLEELKAFGGGHPGKI